MSNLKSATGQHEDNDAATQGDKVLSMPELGGLAGGVDIDYGKWSDEAVEDQVRLLTDNIGKYMHSGYPGSARNASKMLYDAETELIRRRGYGQYSSSALYCKS